MSEIGYNKLLYPTPKETRTLLTWLVQRLPKADEVNTLEELTPEERLRRSIRDGLRTWQKQTRVVPCLSKYGGYGYPFRRSPTRSLVSCRLVTPGSARSLAKLPRGISLQPCLGNSEATLLHRGAALLRTGPAGGFCAAAILGQSECFIVGRPTAPTVRVCCGGRGSQQR